MFYLLLLLDFLSSAVVSFGVESGEQADRALVLGKYRKMNRQTDSFVVLPDGYSVIEFSLRPIK